MFRDEACVVKPILCGGLWTLSPSLQGAPKPALEQPLQSLAHGPGSGMTFQTHPACSLCRSSVLCVRPVSRVRFLVVDVCVASASSSRAAVNAPGGTRVHALCGSSRGGLPGAPGGALCVWPGVVCLPRSSQKGALASRCPQLLLSGVQLSGCRRAAVPSSWGSQLSGCRAARRGRQWSGTVWVLACGSLVTSGLPLLLLCCWASVSLGDKLVRGLCPFPCLHHWVVRC